MNEDLVIWWLTAAEIEVIGAPVELPVSVQREFEAARRSSAQDTVLSVSSILPASHLRWAEAIGIHCSKCNAIVVSQRIAERIWSLDLPGMLTTPQLKRWAPARDTEGPSA